MFRLAGVWLTAALLLASIAPSWVAAQSTEDSWSDPVNLSRTGDTANLEFVIDWDGVGHAVWQDALGNFLYTRFDGEQWSPPAMTDLGRLFKTPEDVASRRPQATDDDMPEPVFIAGPGEYVFAFWIDGQGQLFASKVKNHSLEKISAWDTPRLVAPRAVAFAVAIDARGELHLAYQSGIDEESAASAGIYYTRSKNSGVNWGKAVRVYESPYFRSLTEGEASLSVATAETDSVPRVFVAWDNRPRKQVFLTQSADGGETWSETMLVAGPTPDTALGDPFNIRVGTHNDSVVLVWQNGEPAGECSQVFQSSVDGGITWTDPQVMIDGLLGCALANRFVPRFATETESPSYFLTETKSQTFLSLWDGRQWSQSQAQPMLSGFKEPEIFTEVLFACHHAAMLGERLFVVGCDQGEGGDIWATSRDLGSDSSGLQPPVWNQASTVTSDKLELDAVELLTTPDGLVHSFFIQHQDPDIYYTNWDGESWSRIARVLKLPDGAAGVPAIAAGPADELFLVVPDNRGALYFSRTTSAGAATAPGWSTLKPMQIGDTGNIGSADVARDEAGTVYVAYSIPVNDDRGVYVVQSKDQGATWTEPLQLFDGVEAGYDFIGAPSVLLSGKGAMHVTWNVQTVQGDGSPQPVALFYARSEDRGTNFTDAQLLLDEPVVWRAIVNDSKGQMHLLWQVQNTRTTVWDQVSLDGGHTWQYPKGLPVQGRLATLTSDPAGSLHLLHLGSGILGQWQWDGDGWKAEAELSLPLTAQQENATELLAGVVNKTGKMLVVLARPASEGATTETTLLYSSRNIELPRAQTDNQADPTGTPVQPTAAPQMPTLVDEPTVAPTLEIQPTGFQTQAANNAAGSRVSPFTIALVPVALLLLGVLGIMIRQVMRAKDR